MWLRGGYAPAPSGVHPTCPFFDILPLSVIGSLYTSTISPPAFVKLEHLNAHFWVSRSSLCSSAPPEPKAQLSAAYLPY